MGKSSGSSGTTQVAEASMPDWAEAFIKNTFIPMAQGVAQNSIGNFENTANAMAQGKYLTGINYPTVNPVGEITKPEAFKPLQVVTPKYVTKTQTTHPGSYNGATGLANTNPSVGGGLTSSGNSGSSPGGRTQKVSGQSNATAPSGKTNQATPAGKK